jgi:hypothetical protein
VAQVGTGTLMDLNFVGASCSMTLSGPQHDAADALTRLRKITNKQSSVGSHDIRVGITLSSFSFNVVHVCIVLYNTVQYIESLQR